MDERKAYNLIGLCARARRLVVGAQAVEQAIRNQKAHLVIIDQHCAKNTQKQYNDLCTRYSVRIVYLPQPCQAAGKPGRMAMAIIDPGFAEAIENELNRESNRG